MYISEEYIIKELGVDRFKFDSSGSQIKGGVKRKPRLLNKIKKTLKSDIKLVPKGKKIVPKGKKIVPINRIRQTAKEIVSKEEPGLMHRAGQFISRTGKNLKTNIVQTGEKILKSKHLKTAGKIGVVGAGLGAVGVGSAAFQRRQGEY